MSIRCHRCGHENEDGTSKCVHCAAFLAAAPGNAASGTVSQALTGVLPSTIAAPIAPTSAAVAEALQPGAELGTRYEIVKLLGRGGMGAVYLARDRELGRQVAVKVIAPHLLTEPAALERFKREIQLSSLVTHPNVLRVYDLGEAGGVKFLTMQFVEGRSLDALLRAERPLPIARAIALFRQVCEGLAAAHEEGILHRDLKPQNVMVDAADRVYLTDFGLATSQFLPAMTQSGMLLGTPHYMSPEQVKSEPTDARSDIFSLGVMLYEMLTGVLPYGGGSMFEVMIRRVQRPPRPAAEINAAIPLHLRGILDRCLVVDKEARYGSIREIVADLDSGTVRAPAVPAAGRRARWRRWPWLAAAGLVLLVAALAGTWAYRQRPLARAPAAATEASAPLPLVAVVPFLNRTGDAALDWTGDGLSRLVADSLALSRHVRVVSRQRVDALRAASRDEAAFVKAATDAGITHVLTGEILGSASGFTVAARLTDTRAGTDIASNRIQGASRSDVIAASNQVATAARRGLRIPLTEGVDTFNADFATRNNEAYEIYVQGLNALSAYKYDEARQLFTQALAKAPDFTMARFRLANVYASIGEADRATEQIRAAVAEAPHLPDREARYVRALDAYMAHRQDEAARQYEELVARYPYDIEPRQYLADIHLKRREWREAIDQGRAMAQIDPQSHSTYAVLGSAYLGLKDYNQAITEFRKYAEREPGSANAHHLLADAYRAQNVLDLAAVEYRKALGADAAFHFSTVSLAEVEVLRGQPRAAETLLAPLAADTKAAPGFRVDAAVGLAALLRAQGRFRESIRVLDQAQAPLRAEQIREALALATQALGWMELGDQKRAERLAREAVTRSPGVPTRYLFALAQVQLAQGRLADARVTAEQIAKGGVSAPETDRTEEKAAAYVRGLAWLKEGKAQQAAQEFSRAVALSGYEYAVYRFGLARAYLAAASHAEALASVTQAIAPGDPADPRLDLDLDRARAGLLLAEINAALGRGAEASLGARRFLEAWSGADRGLPDLATARRLASAR